MSLNLKDHNWLAKPAKKRVRRALRTKATVERLRAIEERSDGT